MLDSPEAVITSLLRYTDWWQPLSASVLQVGGARRSSGVSDGIPSGLLATLDERTELCRRMQAVDDQDRMVLVLWYVKQLAAKDIGRAMHLSRRHVFRRRASAIRKLVEMGEPAPAAQAV
jgi:DNA-directed RNA polymerase specialized sigma24 family protein